MIVFIFGLEFRRLLRSITNKITARHQLDLNLSGGFIHPSVDLKFCSTSHLTLSELETLKLARVYSW